MIVQTVTEQWIDPKEVRELFEGKAPTVAVEVDDELGLEVVPTVTMEEFYGLGKLKDSSFVQSLRKQFDAKGRLSEKQISCLR